MLLRLLPLVLLAAPLQAQTVQTRPGARTPSEIRAPFGLRWGDSTQRIQAAVTGANAKVVKKEEHKGRTRWTIEGLKQENLHRAFFYFEQGGLSEVELDYRNTAWQEAQYNAYLGKLRGMIANSYGPGELLERSKQPVEDVTQTVVGYRWRGGDTIIDLLYFSAVRAPNVYRSVSLHYRIAN